MRLQLLILSLMCGGAIAVRADEPTVSYIFPAGGQRGTTVSFHVGGHYLHDNCPIRMDGDGVVVSEQLQRTERTLWFEGPVIPLPDSQQKEDYPVDHRGSVQIDANAQPGSRWWRVHTSQGVTAGMPFVVGDLPEVVEQEIDGAPIPQQVTLPVTVNGRIFPRRDVDVWTFSLQAGETVVCDVAAESLRSPLDATISVVGPQGGVIARCDDARGRDPRLVFSAEVAGDYAVSIWDAQLGGLQDYVYRLSLRRGPVLESVYPLGAQRGSTVQLESIAADGSAEQQAVSVPADAAEQWHLPWAEQLSLQVSDLPELLEHEPNAEAVSAQQLVVGSVANGRIDEPGDVDVWRLQATKDQPLWLDLNAARLGSPLDSLLQIFNAEGTMVAESDDLASGQTDSALIFRPPTDGDYEVRVSDSFRSRGGAEFAYRLQVVPAADLRPSFQLSLPADALTVNRGGEVKLKVTVERLHGFSEAIVLQVDGLPEGVTVEGTEIPEKKNDVQLVFRADAAAGVSLQALTVRGSVKPAVPEQAVPEKAAAGEQTAVTVAVGAEQQQGTDETGAATIVATVAAGAGGSSGTALWLSVAVPTPFRFLGDFETRYAPRGSAFTRRYRIERGDYAGPLTVSLAERQTRHLQGVTGPVIEVPAGESEFEYTVQLPPWMEIGRTSRTCLMAVGQVTTEDGGTHNVSYTSFEQNDQIIVLVDPGQMSLRLDQESLLAEAGSVAELPFEVQRANDLQGPVTVELIVPQHMHGIVCSPVILAGDTTTGALRLQTAASGAGPFNMPLLVRATVGTGARQVRAEAGLTLAAP